MPEDNPSDAPPEASSAVEAPPAGRWCLVANVLIDRPVGPGGLEHRRGTKHFAPGAKVYVIAAYWGPGGETVTVVGRRRQSHRYLAISLRSAYLTNWRVERIYSPTVFAYAQTAIPEGATPTSGPECEPFEAIASVMAQRQPPQPFVTRTRGA